MIVLPLALVFSTMCFGMIICSLVCKWWRCILVFMIHLCIARSTQKVSILDSKGYPQPDPSRRAARVGLCRGCGRLITCATCR